MKKLSLACFFLALAAEALCSGPSSYSIRFGVIETSPAGVSTIRETTTLPLKLEDTGFLFGFAIVPPDDRPFSLKYVLHLPSAPKHLGGGFAKANPGKPTSTIRSFTKQLSARGRMVPIQPLSFDPGDPIGTWKVEIFVNGQLQKVQSFTVTPP